MSFKITKPHPEVCENYCTKVTHGNLITVALTKTDVSDEALIYYMLSVCQHFGTARDSVGRSALHMAASCGKSRIVTWLITYRDGKVEDKDQESGYTALHRSLFYGRINTAVALIKLGSKMNTLDKDYLTPLEHVMKDDLKPNNIQCKSTASSDEYFGGDLYTWGANSNYTLLGTQSHEFAELSHFHRYYPNERVRTIHLDKYHCMVTCDTKVYAWGHGLGGRLGLNTDNTVLAPKLIRISLKTNASAKCLAIARDHSIFLDGKGNVWTCGLNEYAVLGVSITVRKALVPIHVTTLNQRNIVGVACGRYHSVAYATNTLFTWGLNGGQLGHSENCGQYIYTPTKVPHLFDNTHESILQVCCSDGAIGILTSNNVLVLLHEFQCRRIVLKSVTALYVHVHLFGGKLRSATTVLPHCELHAAIVTVARNVLLWRETDPYLRRCVFNVGRPILVKNFVLNARGCVFTTEDQEVFLGLINRSKLSTTKLLKDPDVGKKSFHAFVKKTDSVLINITKVPRIHRAVYVTCDPDGDNFIVLQKTDRAESPNTHQTTINKHTGIPDHLRSLYTDESTHDFKFTLKHRTFHCHKYILAHASVDLSELIRKSNNNTCIIPDNIRADIFGQMLQFIYTNTCDLIAANDTNSTSRDFDKRLTDKTKHCANTNTHDRKLLVVCAQSFGLCSLQTRVDQIEYSPQYQRENYSEFSDVDVICKGGEVFKAHKCMLVRLEYFRNMFSTRWNQACTTIKINYSRIHVQMLLDFIYTDDLSAKINDMDNLLTLLILSDEFIVDKLRNLCELRLCKHINIKTVANLYHYSVIYAELLELRSLDTITDDNLTDISRLYVNYKPSVFNKRLITPFSCIVNIEKPPSEFRLELLEHESVEIVAKKRSRRRKNSEFVNEMVECENNAPKKSDESAGGCLKNDSADFKGDLLSNDCDFPDLNLSGCSKSPGKCNDWKCLPKLSQKERKRLQSTSDSSSLPAEPVALKPITNPWNIKPVNSAAVNAIQCDISEIIKAERQQKQNLNKMRNRLLSSAQIEDRAILELEKFYNVDSIEDELIEVRRIEMGNVALPIWLSKVKRAEN